MSILQIKKVFGSKSAEVKIEAKKPVAKKTASAVKVASAKVTTPKSVAKAPVAKTTKAPQKVGMVCAEGEQCFWANDGLVLSSLADLQAALSSMSEETFAHHVTKDRNDFAAWVEHVLIDKKCAAELRKAKGKSAALAVVTKTLSSYVV